MIKRRAKCPKCEIYIEVLDYGNNWICPICCKWFMEEKNDATRKTRQEDEEEKG